MSELESRLNQLAAELIRHYRHNRRDTARIAEVLAEIERLEALLPRSEPTPEEIRRRELELAWGEARGRELAAYRALGRPFSDWEEYRRRAEAYHEALRAREALEEALRALGAEGEGR
ncbi:MAG: hypothetical protein ABIM77_07520 [candidate division WOR-3 bacterium]